jgi:hypothetical protein
MASTPASEVWHRKLKQEFSKLAVEHRVSDQTQLLALWEEKSAVVAALLLTVATDTIGKRSESSADLCAIAALFSAWKLADDHICATCPLLTTYITPAI